MRWTWWKLARPCSGLQPANRAVAVGVGVGADESVPDEMDDAGVAGEAGRWGTPPRRIG